MSVKIIADNIQIMNPRVKQALEDKDSGPIKTLIQAINQASRADMLDINPGPPGKHWPEKLEFLLQTVLGVSDLPLCLDSNNPDVLQYSLELCSGRTCLINGFSLEEHKLKTILPLLKIHQVPGIAFLLSPAGKVPTSLEERLAICSELLLVCKQEGLDLDQVIIDPVLPPLRWPDGSTQAWAVLETIRLIPEIANQPMKTIAGLSNLTSGQGCKMDQRQGTDFVESTYLALLCQAGLDYCLLNVFHQRSVQVIRFYQQLRSEKIICPAEFSAQTSHG